MTTRPILLVEDSEDDVLLMRRSLKSAGVLQKLMVAEDGQQAIDYLSGSGTYSDREAFPIPAIVLLDLKLPYKSGHEVLAWIKQQIALAEIIVVVLTSSNQASDLKEAYRLGANSYVVKPPSSLQLVELAKAFKSYWLNFNRTNAE